jgi:hypothetical protein
MAGADKADGADGVGPQMLAEALVEREEGRFHGLHEEAAVKVGGGEDLNKLGFVERGGFFAENVLAGCEGLDAEAGVGVGVGGYIDGVDFGGQELIQR